MGDLTKNFSSEEFACRCPELCAKKDGTKISKNLVATLQVVREEFGFPIFITSGLRCKAWNRETGGVPSSSHVKGKAVDISCVSSSEKYALLPKLMEAFIRLGIGDDFIHVDVDTEKPQGVLWTY